MKLSSQRGGESTSKRISNQPNDIRFAMPLVTNSDNANHNHKYKAGFNIKGAYSYPSLL